MKIFIFDGSDQQMRLKLEEFEKLTSGQIVSKGFADLSGFDRIDVEIFAKDEDIASLKYTTETPTPTGYNVCSVVSNSLSFTIYSEFTAAANDSDYSARIKTTITGGRNDGEDLVQITPLIYVFSIK